jgi:hypothetical protein
MGRRIGGKMMTAWYVFKIVLLFGGYLILPPLLPLTFREKFEVPFAARR